MARRLEGNVFVSGYNNGVVALAHRAVRDDLRRANEIVQALKSNTASHLQVEDIEAVVLVRVGPIFTFADTERVVKSPWFTGDFGLCKAIQQYIVEEHGEVSREGLYVPFSNGLELGFHGSDAQKEELRFVTSNRQFEETFGVSIPALLGRARQTK